MPICDIIRNMKDWNELKNILDGQNISSENQQLIRDFLSSFSFQKRQQLMGVFMGFPEKINLFVDLIKKKMELAKSPNENLSADILNLENKEVENLIKELE